MPDIVSAVGIDRNDGREEPIVALARATIALIPFGPIADTEIDQIEIGIVGDAFPDGMMICPYAARTQEWLI